MIKTTMRQAFEDAAQRYEGHPYVVARLRHLLDRSRSGVHNKLDYTKGEDVEYGNLRPYRRPGVWRFG